MHRIVLNALQELIDKVKCFIVLAQLDDTFNFMTSRNKKLSCDATFLVAKEQQQQQKICDTVLTTAAATTTIIAFL
jgi:hypothetical protein